MMKIEFLENVNISDKVTCFKGERFEAEECNGFVMIRMEDGSTIKAPKDALGKYFRIV